MSRPWGVPAGACPPGVAAIGNVGSGVIQREPVHDRTGLTPSLDARLRPSSQFIWGKGGHLALGEKCTPHDRTYPVEFPRVHLTAVGGETP
jgi:hypothetical protein